MNQGHRQPEAWADSRQVKSYRDPNTDRDSVW